MLPYFSATIIPLGPVNIQVWGLFVAIGIIVSVLLARWYALRHDLDAETILDLSSWSVLGGIVGARLGHVLFYAPSRYIADPLSILRVWEGGMSMFGAFIGAAIAATIYFHRTDLNWPKYVDAIAFAFPLGYGIGRIGCFLIHDHPGTLSSLFFAIKFPGGPRLDHGMLLSLVGFAIFAWFITIELKNPSKRLHGYLARLALSYGLARFILDFFRAYDLPNADIRFGSLTPAQYFAIVCVGLGVWLLRRERATRTA